MLYIQFCPGIRKNKETVTEIIQRVISCVPVCTVPCLCVSLGIVVHRVFNNDVSPIRLRRVKRIGEMNAISFSVSQIGCFNPHVSIYLI